MNIVTAPLLYLTGRIPTKVPYGRPPPPGQIGFQVGPLAMDGLGCFLLVTILIALALVGVGLYLEVVGQTGTTEISGMGITVKTTDAGIGLAALGVIFWLAAGKMIVDKFG